MQTKHAKWVRVWDRSSASSLNSNNNNHGTRVIFNDDVRGGFVTPSWSMTPCYFLVCQPESRDIRFLLLKHNSPETVGRHLVGRHLGNYSLYSTEITMYLALSIAIAFILIFVLADASIFYSGFFAGYYMLCEGIVSS